MEIEQVKKSLEQKAGFISTLSSDVAFEVQKYIDEAMKVLEVCIDEKNKKLNRMEDKIKSVEMHRPSSPDSSGELFEIIGTGLRRLSTGRTVYCKEDRMKKCNNDCVGYQMLDTGDIRICTGQEIYIKRDKKPGKKKVE